jgi:hypothetical protein
MLEKSLKSKMQATEKLNTFLMASELLLPVRHFNGVRRLVTPNPVIDEQVSEPVSTGDEMHVVVAPPSIL